MSPIERGSAEIQPVEHISQASASATLYPLLGFITHEASVSKTITYLEPPFRRPNQLIDIDSPDTRNYYANFYTLATQTDPETQEVTIIENRLAAARAIWSLANHVTKRLLQMQGGHPLSEHDLAPVVQTLDFITEEVGSRRIWLPKN